MLNGDVLTDIDLTAQLGQHERTGARVTLALIAVEDPSAYGLVRRRDDGSVKEFVEKPRPEQIDTNLINAGAYMLERDVLDAMAPAGTRISIEREVFPELVGGGLYGYEAAATGWTSVRPERYLQATYDILEGDVSTEVGPRVAAAGAVRCRRCARSRAACTPRRCVGSGLRDRSDAIVGGRTVLGRGVQVGARRPRRELGAARRARSGPAPDQRLDHRPGRGDRGALPDRPRRGPRRGRQDRSGQHPHRRRAYLPRGGAARRSDQRFEPNAGGDRCPARRSPRSTRPASWTTSSGCPISCATRCGAWSRPT